MSRPFLGFFGLCALFFAYATPAYAERADITDAGVLTSPAQNWQLRPALDEPAALTQADPPLSAPPPPVYGPPSPDKLPPEQDGSRYASFGSQVGAVKWEVIGLAGYMTAINVVKIARVGAQPFHFQDEGWFEKSTINLGVDKLTHAFNSYMLSDLLYYRIKRKTGDAPGSALTAAILASGLMAYSELFDAHKKSSGFSYQDIVANMAGAGFSVLRNEVPSLKEKVDFRMMVMPNSNFYTFTGTGHYAQQRFLLAMQFSGFKALEKTPLRFVELHAGYYASGFTARERERGERLDRRPFIGIGVNLQELFFKSPRSKVGRAARSVLDYVQVPYTAVHVH